MDGWYYQVDDGERRGPFTFEQMKALVGDGAIRRQTRVWRPGAAADALTRAGDFIAELVTKPDETGLAYLLPVGRSGWAIAAGYLGLLSLLPMVCYAGLAISIVAARDLKRHPEKRGWGRVITGFVISIPASIIYTVLLFVAVFR